MGSLDDVRAQKACASAIMAAAAESPKMVALMARGASLRCENDLGSPGWRLEVALRGRTVTVPVTLTTTPPRARQQGYDSGASEARRAMLLSAMEQAADTLSESIDGALREVLRSSGLSGEALDGAVDRMRSEGLVP